MKKTERTNENAKDIINDVRRIIQAALRTSRKARISYYPRADKSNAAS